MFVCPNFKSAIHWRFGMHVVPFTSTWKLNFRSSFDVILPARQKQTEPWLNGERHLFKLFKKPKKSPSIATFKHSLWTTIFHEKVKKLEIPNLVRSNNSICLKIKMFFRFIIFNEGYTIVEFKYMIELLWIIWNYFFGS